MKHSQDTPEAGRWPVQGGHKPGCERQPVLRILRVDCYGHVDIIVYCFDAAYELDWAVH